MPRPLSRDEMGLEITTWHRWERNALGLRMTAKIKDPNKLLTDPIYRGSAVKALMESIRQRIELTINKAFQEGSP